MKPRCRYNIETEEDEVILTKHEYNHLHAVIANLIRELHERPYLKLPEIPEDFENSEIPQSFC